MSPGQTFVKTWALQTPALVLGIPVSLYVFSAATKWRNERPCHQFRCPVGKQTYPWRWLSAYCWNISGNWRLADDSDISFGEIIDVVIDVNGSETELQKLQLPILRHLYSRSNCGYNCVPPTVATTVVPPTVATTVVPPTVATTVVPPTVATTVVLHVATTVFLQLISRAYLIYSIVTIVIPEVYSLYQSIKRVRRISFASCVHACPYHILLSKRSLRMSWW